MKKLLSLSLITSVLVLSACGGGGDESGFVDPYIGNWKGCINLTAGYHTLRTRVFSKGGANNMNVAIRDDNRYSDSSCTALTATEVIASSPNNAIQLKNVLNFQGRSGHEGTITYANGATEIFYITTSGSELRVGGGLTNGAFSGWTAPYTKQ